MSGIGGKDAARSDEAPGEISQAEARPFKERQLANAFPELDPGDLPKVLSKLDDEEYHIGSGKRGKCVIFNYKTFPKQTGLKERTGAEIDVRQLSDEFGERGFDIIVHNDLSMVDTLQELQILGKQDYTQDDSFVCWILTHGDNGCLYTADGEQLIEDNFISPFRKNKGLLGKPKLFFIQTCRGHIVDQGQSVVIDISDSSSRICRIPNQADLLVAYSSFPGYLSWRRETDGSWFVHAFCYVLRNSTGSEDLFALLTKASRFVAIKYEANTPDNSFTHGAKQMPYVTSTLTRCVRFPKMP